MCVNVESINRSYTLNHLKPINKLAENCFSSSGGIVRSVEKRDGKRTESLVRSS